jgi:hypothetical protein
MLCSSTILKYPVLTIVSMGKRSFENMGNLIKRSGDTVKRLLSPADQSFEVSRAICKEIFAKRKTVYVGIDDTLIRKIYSRFMQGAGFFFDTKIGRCIMAYRLAIGIITDGKFTIPINCAYMFAKEILDSIEEKFPTKDEIAQSFVLTAINLFPDKTLIAVVDGLYTTIAFVRWCKGKKMRLEARMHSNRVVTYKGKRIKVKDLLNIKGLRPKGRQMARTIPVVWHDIDLELTIVRRFDKKGRESIVFQIATYKALPRDHKANYDRRWNVEMLNRTTKQEIGLQECFSRSLEIQHRHVASVLLAYSLAQLERKNSKLEKVEHALKRCKTKKVDFLINRFARILKDFPEIYA